MGSTAEGVGSVQTRLFKKAEATTPDGPPSRGGRRTALMFSGPHGLDIQMFGFGREQGVECRSMSKIWCSRLLDIGTVGFGTLSAQSLGVPGACEEQAGTGSSFCLVSER
jgi:hypothetical protein